MTALPVAWAQFPEYDASVAAGVAAGLSWQAITDDLNAHFGLNANSESVRKRWDKVKTPKVGEASEGDTFAAKVRSEREKASDRALAREMASAVKMQARWDEFLDIVRGELSRTPRSEAVRQLDIPKGSGTPETMVVLIGDIHIGKLVDPGVVGDGFGYGIPIFEQRMARLKDRILRLYGLHSQTAPIDRIRLYFLGDGVDGTDMRRGHGHRVDVQTATAQVLILTYACEDLTRELSAALGVPVEWVWEYGNHGRVGDFGVNLPADNWDYIAGQMLGIALRDKTEDGSVKLHADTLKYSITQLGPYRVMSSHGDSIKGGDGFAGIPINGLARALAKDTGLHQQLFDLYLAAHFHTPQDLTTQTGRIIQNGSWDGGDDYSVNALKVASEPIQFAFGIHPTKGMTWSARINLRSGTRPPSPVALS